MDPISARLAFHVFGALLMMAGAVVVIVGSLAYPYGESIEEKPKTGTASISIDDIRGVTVADNVFIPPEGSGVFIDGVELTNENVKRHSDN